MTGRCPVCGGNLALIGRVHHCVPARSQTVEQRPLKAKVAGSNPAASAKPGRPRLEDADKTIESQKPWEAEGMSRRTWYRRKRKNDLGDFG